MPTAWPGSNVFVLMYEEAGTAMWAIAIVVAALDYVSAQVREKIV